MISRNQIAASRGLLKMDRRTFNELLCLSALGTAVLPLEARGSIAAADEAPARPSEWPGQTYRRSLVDMHIPDWDPSLLARFDAEDFVKTIADAGFQSVMPYANSSVGLCLWDTKVGQKHGNMKGRDYFGEIMQARKRHGLRAVAYYCIMFDNWAYEYHPDWRLVPDDDSIPSHPQRYGFACPNTPYREHTLASLRELVGKYDFDGIFIDMTMWPDVCYCAHCIEKFRSEAGVEPPRIVDWDDPTWRKFQAARQRWMLEFAQDITHAVKQTRPITVSHQYSSILHHWRFGAPLELRDAMDYACGDFYGGPAQHSLVCKTFHGLSRKGPIEFMTSRTRDLRDHATTKPFEEVRMESLVAPLHSAAFMMIDAINVDGTLNHGLYKFLTELNVDRAPYEPFLGGDLLADVAIYFDKESVYNPNEQRMRVGQLRELESNPHLDAVVGLARILREAHIPFGVVTNATLDQLDRYRAVLLPTVFEMTAAQAERFRAFVHAGGVLYASGPSSLDRFNPNGPRFLLEDVFGVSYQGVLGGAVKRMEGGAGKSEAGEQTSEAWRSSWTYLSPQDPALKKLLWPQTELSYAGPMTKVTALPGAEILATVTLPFVPPALGRPIGSHFGAIHSNPPNPVPGIDPGIVANTFGQGKAIWVAAPIETSAEAVNARVVAALVKRDLPAPYHFEVETHPSVEMTLFHQKEQKRLLVGLLTMQDELPAFPVSATVRVLAPGKVKAVLQLPARRPLKFSAAAPYVEFALDPFNSLSMALVEYE
jgi:hypothetical protein